MSETETRTTVKGNEAKVTYHDDNVVRIEEALPPEGEWGQETFFDKYWEMKTTNAERSVTMYHLDDGTIIAGCFIIGDEKTVMAVAEAWVDRPTGEQSGT